LRHVQRRADVFEVLRARRVVDKALQLVSDEAFDGYDAKVSQRSGEIACCGEQASRDKSMSVQKIQALVRARVVGGVRASVGRRSGLTLPPVDVIRLIHSHVRILGRRA